MKRTRPSRGKSTVVSENLVTILNPLGDEVTVKLTGHNVRRAVKLLQDAILPGGRTALRYDSSRGEIESTPQTDR